MEWDHQKEGTMQGKKKASLERSSDNRELSLWEEQKIGSKSTKRKEMRTEPLGSAPGGQREHP
ncbi:hypothetical protein VN97_g6187, partial [Penicillium thymicola]